MNPRPVISLEGVSKTYLSGDRDIYALENVNLAVAKDEIACVVGPSGCGKTTLVSLIAGFLAPTSGRVLVNGLDVSRPDGTCGVVFQTDSVFPWMTVRENIGYGLRFRSLGADSRRHVVDQHLHLIGLTEYAANWPRELSGGMKKRVELARSFAADPQVLLLDEPFGSLDVITREEMQVVLLSAWEQEKKAILLVTHDVEEALFVGTRVIVMTPQPGRISAEFPVPFAFPRDPELKLRPDFVELRHKIADMLRSAPRARASAHNL